MSPQGRTAAVQLDRAVVGNAAGADRESKGPPIFWNVALARTLSVPVVVMLLLSECRTRAELPEIVRLFTVVGSLLPVTCAAVPLYRSWRQGSYESPVPVVRTLPVPAVVLMPAVEPIFRFAPEATTRRLPVTRALGPMSSVPPLSTEKVDVAARRKAQDRAALKNEAAAAVDRPTEPPLPRAR